MSLITGMSPFTVTLAAPSTRNEWKVTAYAAAVSYAAMISYKTRRVTGTDGRTIESTCQVYIDGDVTVDERYQITLPAGFVLVDTRAAANDHRWTHLYWDVTWIPHLGGFAHLLAELLGPVFGPMTTLVAADWMRARQMLKTVFTDDEWRLLIRESRQYRNPAFLCT